MTSRPLRIALISEHASPLATIGSIDAGGQNIYVLNVAKCLARAGHHVDVLTRRDDPALPAIVDVRPGMRVVHVSAGPAAFVAKEQLLRHMPAFIEAARERGVTRLFLEMRDGNPAGALYRRFGFVTIGRRRHYYRRGSGGPCDAITFARTLQT